ncbi:protein containing PIN domain [Bacteroidales bacterium 6E]|nr:protein containing PIN domain [Bacteroidales bacterium 6E]
MNKKIEHYQWFFSDQLRQMELEQKTIITTPISQLLQNGKVTMGYVDKAIPGSGHIVIKFPRGYAPRLKVPKSFVVIKKNAFATYGTHLKDWSCSLGDFKKDGTMHTVSSDLFPLFFIPSNDGYEYVDCSSVSSTLFNLLQGALNEGKSLTVLIFEPFPPIDYFMNLKRYMDLYPENKELLLEPKIDYEDWHPEELSFNPEVPDAIAEEISKIIDKDNCCILQGPPGTGKSYVIATIIAEYIKCGKTVCATTMANKGLIELIRQKPLKEALSSGKISKTNLSADERRTVPDLKSVDNGLLIPNGELLCSTNYILSGVFSSNRIETHGLPNFDLVVIEEASQAFLTAVVAFKSLGKRCLIVGDPMQLPPIVKALNKPQYNLFNVKAQLEGMTTFALGTDLKAFRIITSHRLTSESAKLTGMFYENRLSSVNSEYPDFSKIIDPHLLPKGGVVYEVTNDMRNSVCSETALKIIDRILNKFKEHYPDTEIAIIAPFNDTVEELQKNFQTVGSLKNLTVETVDRIQGMTVDYTIMYFPGWKPSFALEERRFNVSTSRSRTTTLILSDVPLENMHSAPPSVLKFIERCFRINDAGKITLPIEVQPENPKPIESRPEQIKQEVPAENGMGVKVVGKIDLSKFEKPKKELSQDKENIYIIDTNVFVECPEIISKIDKKYRIVLSAKVIDELDKLKISLPDEQKMNVQKALRFINENLGKRKLDMDTADLLLLPADFNKKSPDNLILSVALKYKSENPIMLTSDNGLQIKAKGLQITTISLKDFLKQLRY